MKVQSPAEDFGRFDYIVIGAGSAGCVLANRLSADPACRVLILEAGGKDDYFWIHVPVGYLYTMGNPRTDWNMSTVAEKGLNGRSIPYPRGRVLGGSSSINGMIYMRGQAQDYDTWRQLGNVGWGWEDVLPYFKRSEDHYQRNDEFHAQGGEWRVEPPRVRWAILDAIRDAAEELGIPKVDDFNTGDNEGSSYFQVNQRRGVRWSASKAFLRPALKRPNLTLLTGAAVRQLTVEDGRVTGLQFSLAGQLRSAGAREVILAAGAVASPQLLQLSGIGPGDLLARLGIAVVHELPGVGENLQDHLQIRPIFRIRNALTLNQRVATLRGKASIAAEYAVRRSGPMSMGPSQLGIFARSDPSYASANIQYHVQPLSFDRYREPLHPFPGVTLSVCNLRPDSRGHIRVVSPDPALPPEIAPNYLSTESDRRVAAQSIEHARRLMRTRRMAEFSPEELTPGANMVTEDALVRAAGDISTTIFHPVGTARMGSDPMAVVDARLRVHGIAGVRVVDASVMPRIVSGNTNSPTIMIAEKGAQMILEDARR